MCYSAKVQKYRKMSNFWPVQQSLELCRKERGTFVREFVINLHYGELEFYDRSSSELFKAKWPY